MLAPWKKSYNQPRQHIKKQRHYFANKRPSSQSYGFFSSHVWVWELDYKEIWVLKNWCFWTVVLDKTLESPLDCKEIKSVLKIHWKDWCWSSNTLATWSEELKRKGSLEKTLWLWKAEGRKSRGQQRMRWLNVINHSLDRSLTELQEIVKDKGTWCTAVQGVAKSQTWLSNWRTTKKNLNYLHGFTFLLAELRSYKAD